MLLSRFIFQGNVLAYIGDNVPVPTFFTVCYLILEGKALFFLLLLTCASRPRIRVVNLI